MCIREYGTLPDSSWRDAWKAVQEAVGRNQNPGVTLLLGLGYAGMLCRLGRAPAGQLHLALHGRACARACVHACPCLEKQFSSLNFTVLVKHVYCRTTGKDRKLPRKEKALNFIPCSTHKENSSVLYHCAFIQPLWGFFSQQC